MADLNTALSPPVVQVGDGNHAGLHSQERDYIEELRKWSRNVGGATAKARPIECWVVSADAPADLRTAAAGDGYMFLCDGTDDGAEFNSAISQAAPLPAYNTRSPASAKQIGKVHVSGGRFTIGNTPILMRTGVHLQGQGKLSEIKAVGTPTTTGQGVGADMALIKSASSYEHMMTVSDLLLEGNYSAGGGAHAIYFDSDSGVASASAVTSDYPNSSPDAYVSIHDVDVFRFDGGTARHGIWINGLGGSSNLRGATISNCMVRILSGHAISLVACSDSTVEGCHVGGAAMDGYHIATGNTRLIGNKAYYCDQNGFNVTSSRCTVASCEVQDSATGFYLGSSNAQASGLMVDNCSADGIVVAADNMSLAGFQVVQRSGGRYATLTNGVRFAGAYTRCYVTGVVTAASITNPVSGVLGAGSFSRIPGVYSIG